MKNKKESITEPEYSIDNYVKRSEYNCQKDKEIMEQVIKKSISSSDRAFFGDNPFKKLNLFVLPLGTRVSIEKDGKSKNYIVNSAAFGEVVTLQPYSIGEFEITIRILD